MIKTTPTSITISWEGLPENMTTGYAIFRDGQHIAAIRNNVYRYTDNGLTPNSVHTYTVRINSITNDIALVTATILSESSPDLSPESPPKPSPTPPSHYQP